MLNNITSVTPQEYPKKLPGSMWGITVFFNPVGYQNKYNNYKIFRENTKRQGLKLIAVELVFAGEPELKNTDADMVVRIFGNKNNIMWQKEALINVGIDNLPADCDKFIWIDSDIVFQDENWVKKTASLLERYNVVQPYSLVNMTQKNKADVKCLGDVCARVNFDNRTGQHGLVWAARREVFSQIKLYDRLIIGSADLLMSDSFYSPNVVTKEFNSKAMLADMEEWCKSSFDSVKKSVFYLDGAISHLWHGEFRNRFYIERRFILDSNDFDPKKDIRKNNLGIWEWSCNKKKMIKYVKAYFYLRNEENDFSLRYMRLRLDFLANRLTDGQILFFFNLKKDASLGYAGLLLKRINPKLYRYLSGKKPNWAKSLEI